MTELEKQLSNALAEQSRQYETRLTDLTGKVATLTTQLLNNSGQLDAMSKQVEDLTKLLNTLGDNLNYLLPKSKSSTSTNAPRP